MPGIGDYWASGFQNGCWRFWENDGDGIGSSTLENYNYVSGIRVGLGIKSALRNTFCLARKRVLA